MTASSVADWTLILRAAEQMRFTRAVPWDGRALWFVEFAPPPIGRLHRDLIVDGDTVRTRADEDV